MCCTWLAVNTGRKNDTKNRHLGTIPQLCRAISSQLRHVSTIGKKLVKLQYLLHMSPQYGELRPTSGWDRFGSLGHPSHFQRLPRLRSVTALQSSSERQPNFAALNRGRHLCSAGRPSRWALAHISSFFLVFRSLLLLFLVLCSRLGRSFSRFVSYTPISIAILRFQYYILKTQFRMGRVKKNRPVDNSAVFSNSEAL